MAGHSKWANIKHRKASQDAKRGKAFTKISKEITVCAKISGGDPDDNPRLRTLLEKARGVNMPSDTVTRAIKKGTGELPGVSYEAHTYEGYGPAGIAIIIETLTDNKNRCIAEVRKVFNTKGVSLADNGSVSWMFDHTGVVRAQPGQLTEDDLLEELIDFDVTNITVDEDLATIVCEPKSIEPIRKLLVDKGLTIESADLEWVAKEPIKLSEADAEKAYTFLEAIEDLDDVQDVYSNIA